METILSYLDNMFLNMAKTPEVLQAKEELASMMEDKYNELLAQGKKENEAIGIVISEFGNLEELAEELGLGTINARNNTSGVGNGMPVKIVSRQEAENYISLAEQTSKWIAAGVMLCIMSPIILLLCGTVQETMSLSDAQVVCIGLVPLFIMIGLAVAIFIYNGMKMERFEYLKKENIQVDARYEKQLRQLEEEDRPSYTVKIIVGVMLCILAVLQLIVIGSVYEDNDFVAVVSVAILLVIVGIAVVIFIIGGSRHEAIKVLLQEGDYTKGSKKKSKVIDIIAGVYWPIITIIYLSWSFITMSWEITWIIWPLAGILFGGIAAITSVITNVANQ